MNLRDFFLRKDELCESQKFVYQVKDSCNSSLRLILGLV